MQLNIKVVKNWQPLPLPHFFIKISFQGYPPCLAKFWVSPQVTQFFKGPTPPLMRRERGGPTMHLPCKILLGGISLMSMEFLL